MINIQWYPGHMAQAKQLVKKNLRLVDLVLELIDARIPLSSRNPESPGIFTGRPCLIVMNKADLADPALTRDWIRFFASRGEAAVAAESRTGKGLKELRRMSQELAQPRLKSKGLKRPVRVMVVGIPNVGKSSLLNRLVGRKAASVGDRPGVTRGPQWVKVEGTDTAGEGMDILDTPGVLWPKFDDPEVGMKLAATGAVKDEIIPRQDVTEWLINLMNVRYAGVMESRYGLGPDRSSYEWLEAIARQRGFLGAGGRVDMDKAVAAVLDDFRGGKLGQFTLEKPGETC